MMAKVAKAYESIGFRDSVSIKLVLLLVVIAGGTVFLRFLTPNASVDGLIGVDGGGLTQSSLTSHSLNRKIINSATWNIAAINNNPFEYWITNEDPKYNQIMAKASGFVANPEKYDIPVGDVFSEAQFLKLEEYMIRAGWQGSGPVNFINITRRIWDEDLKKRKIMSGFIRDSVLGKKRLISMPDRVTNTINTVDQGVIYRPTVINCYEKSFGSSWFSTWLKFMFDKKIEIQQGESSKILTPAEMIGPIKRSKYPAVTEEEEAASLPLQTLCCAIFDSILIYMMNTIAGEEWEPLRQTMCNNLNRHKLDRTIEILETTYADQDIVFLQEVAGSFAVACKDKHISKIYDIHLPAEMDSDRDQNSFILLKKGKFREVREVTNDVLKELAALTVDGKPAPVMKGDLLALTALDAADGTKYLFASFHGDTNGLATVPVVTATYNYALNQIPQHKLIFGMDANTYSRPEADQQGVVEFGKFFKSKKLNSCYGDEPNPFNFTTFHARTHLQPQLNKAVSLEEKDLKGDKNPKDFILFFNADFSVLNTVKDNTGSKKFIEGMIFPTLAFPSDHGVTSTVMVEISTDDVTLNNGIGNKHHARAMKLVHSLRSERP